MAAAPWRQHHGSSGWGRPRALQAAPATAAHQPPTREVRRAQRGAVHAALVAPPHV
jgi:hypothetical protein